MLQVFLLNLRWGKPRAGTELGSVPGFSVTCNCGPNFLLPAWLDLELTWKHTSRCFCEGLQKEVSLPSKCLQSCQSCVLNESQVFLRPGMWAAPSASPQELESWKRWKERREAGSSMHLSAPMTLCVFLWMRCEQLHHRLAALPFPPQRPEHQTMSINKRTLPSVTFVTYSVTVLRKVTDIVNMDAT